MHSQVRLFLFLCLVFFVTCAVTSAWMMLISYICLEGDDAAECMTYFKLWPLVFVDWPVIQLNLRIKMNKEQTNVFSEGEGGVTVF